MSEHLEAKPSLNFIEEIIEADLKSGSLSKDVHTRFPPEPNGFLHIGHAKAICLNFGLAQKYQGKCNLRFDDTNPAKEEQKYIDAIKNDIKWLGFDWGETEFYASDYFDKLYDLAIQLIELGKAYVDDQTAEEITQSRGTPTSPGENSPYRNRTIEENKLLFQQMKNGEFAEGSKVLRAKIDMASPYTYLRDPIMYRILFADHPRTGTKWCIFPTYDWAHGQSDALEQITHSLCTLEFKIHRPLYDWYIDTLNLFPSKQREFARLNLAYTVVTKRKLIQLVEEGIVNGWDDPRMPTISGLRRRGYTPRSIRNFCDTVGIAKRDGIIDVALLEHSVKDDLNKIAPRRMGVMRPLKMVITNFPDDKIEDCQAINNPEDETMGTRLLPLTKEIYIEKSDFMEEPPRKFFRLGPDREVRLKFAYIVKCESFDKDPETGEVTTVYCTYDPDSKSGQDTTGKKVKGTLSWVSASEAVNAEIRLYDRLFTVENPLEDKEKDFKDFINPSSLEVLVGAKVEPSLVEEQPFNHFQFERQGYFNVDPDSTAGKLIFNRTVPLRDNWAKKQQKN